MTILDASYHFLNVHADATSGRSEAQHVSRVDSLSGIDTIASDWDRVQDNCSFHHVLLDHRWVRAWWNAFGQGKDLHGLVIGTASEVQGIAPMILSRGWEAWPSRDGPLQIADDHMNLGIPRWRRIIPIRRVTFPLNIPSHNARAHALVAGDPSSACSAIIDYWDSRATEWDVMVLEGLPAGSGQREAFMSAAASRGFRVHPSGRVRVMYRADLSGGLDAYLSRRSSNFRKSRTKEIRNCHRAGHLELRVYRKSDISRGLSIMFDIERQTWKARADSNSQMKVPLNDHIRDFLTEVGLAFASTDEVAIHVMSLDNRPVGAIMGLSRQKVMVGLLNYLCDDVRGTLNVTPLMDSMIQDALAHGIDEIDMNGVTPWARKWSTREDSYQRLYIFNRHLRAQILGVSKALATNLSQLSKSVEWEENGNNDGSH